MAAQNHDVLMVAGIGAAALAGWEFIYKPWKAKQAGLTSGTSLFGPSGAAPAGSAYGSPYITSPTVLSPQPIQPSNLNPGAAVGGPVGTCMSRKGWPQGQCQQRLDALVASFNFNKAKILSLQPGGSSIIQAQAQLAATQTVLANASAGYNQAIAAGDAAGVQLWKKAMDDHSADISALSASINSAPQQITAAQSAMASNASDYQALTGLTLS